MGLFLTFSILKAAALSDIEKELKNYSVLNFGGLEKSEIERDNPNFCSIRNIRNLAIIVYPQYFVEYFQVSEHLSKLLNLQVYTFSIYDGDYWILSSYYNGELISKFNPFPNYWTEKEDRDFMKTSNFEISKFCEDFEIEVRLVEKYFVEWTNATNKKKAYRYDKFQYGDCMQLFDLLQHISITYEDLCKNENKGLTYKLWTSSHPVDNFNNTDFEDIRKAKRYTLDLLKLTPNEIEFLFDTRFNVFIEESVKRHFCLQCNKQSAERENLEFFLSVGHCSVLITGKCKSCGKKSDNARVITNLVNLIKILEN